jgi:hypothetical protein
MRRSIPVLAFALACGNASSPGPSSAVPVASASAAPSATAVTAPPPPSASAPVLVLDGPTSGSVRRGCDHKGYVAPAGAKPALFVSARGALLDVSWVNQGTAPVCLLTHVQAIGEHFDWLRVVVDGGPAPTRNLTFVDDRNHSVRVSYELGPGARLTKTIDAGEWAKRRLNGGLAIVPGGYNAIVTYDSSHETTAWAGTLRATTTFVVKKSLLTDP